MSSQTDTAHNTPSPGTYAKIAVVLCVVTGIEFGAFYVEALRPIFVPLILILSAIKFYLVVAYYMHLKSESKSLVTIFTTSLALAIATGGALAVLLLTFGLFATQM